MERKDRDALRALLEKATAGPWEYRPHEHDDWGFIRGAEIETSFGNCQPVVALSRDADLADYDAHRRAGTDPYEPNGRFIAAARNALPAFLDELDAKDALVAELVGALEKTRQEMVNCELAFSDGGFVYEQEKANCGRAIKRIDAALSQMKADASGDVTSSLIKALEQIAADCPATDPGPAFDDGWVSHGNYDDVAYDAKQEICWAHGQIARAALAKAGAK